MSTQLPVPSFFNPANAEKMYMIDYPGIEKVAYEMRRKYGVKVAATDRKHVTAMGIDDQNTFCLPYGQLFVAGRSGRGAIDDSNRYAQFIYREAANLTELVFTMDTHFRMQIFHTVMLVNSKGQHPQPNSLISLADIEAGVWKANPELAPILADGNLAGLQAYLLHYVRELKRKGRYDLTAWAYHGILGGASHALVSVIEEVAWYHNVLRTAQTDFQIKGGKNLTENYSVLGPEVTTGVDGKPMFQKNTAFLKKLLEADRLIIGGQAKSHCVAWTIADLLDDIAADPKLAKKVYLLEDCTSPVVIPGIVDYTKEADEAFAKFAAAGMHVVKSTTPMDQWPDF